MPKAWQLRIKRGSEQVRGKSRRTVGEYQVFHDDVAVKGLYGVCAETRGPGDNSHAGNGRCVEAGVYPLFTEGGEKYLTIGYTSNTNPKDLKRPALLLGETGHRVGILIHPARGFLWSVGCINPGRSLDDAAANLDFIDSRTRVIALIDDLAAFLGPAFPKQNNRPISGASVLIA